MRGYIEHLKILRELEVDVIGFRWSGKHYVARCRSTRGDIFQTTFSKTPSDYRAMKNWRSVVRRLANGAAR